MLLTAVALLAAAGPIFEIRSPHFRVATTLGLETATAAATRLERAHAQFVALGFAVPDSITDVLLGDDLPIGSAVGIFQQGSDASFIAVQWSAADDSLRALVHELAHQAMASFSQQHPPWLREGLAELLSNVEAAEGGVRIGLPIAAHVGTLRKAGGPESYARDWLLAHQAVVGRTAGDSLAARLKTLTTPRHAEPRLPDNLLSEVLPVAARTAPWDPAVRQLASWQLEHRVAEMLRATHKTAEARAALESLRSRLPDRPEPLESLGALDMDAFEYDRAEQRLAEAVRLGSVNPSTHYRYSLLLMRPGPPVEERTRRAAFHARSAAEGSPSQPLYWLARAHAEMQLAQWDTARSSLAEMRARAGDPLLLEQVRVELDEVERRRQQQARGPLRLRPPEKLPPLPEAAPEAALEPPPEAASISPAPSTVASPRRPERHPGTLTFWGYVRKVECGEAEKILTVSNRVFAIRVRERATAPAKLHYPPQKWRRIPCTLQNVEVNVVYRPSPQFGPVNGDLVAVIF